MRYKILFITTTCVLYFFTTNSIGGVATFSPRFSVSAEYTDNTSLSSANEEGDYYTLVSAGFTAEAIWKKSGLILSYDPTFSFYNENTEYNTLRQNARLSIWRELTKNTRLDLQNSFLYTEDPYSRPSRLQQAGEDTTALSTTNEPDLETNTLQQIEADTTIRTGRNTYYTNVSSVGLSHQFGEGNSVSAGYAYTILDNEARNIADGLRHNPSINITYWFVPVKWSFDAGISQERGEFEDTQQTVFDGDGNKIGFIDTTPVDFDNWNGSVSLIRKFTKRFEGFVQYTHTLMQYDRNTGGYQTYDPSLGINYIVDKGTFINLGLGYLVMDRDESEDDTYISINSSIIKTWPFKRGLFNLTGSSGYRESYLRAENLGFDIFYSAGGGIRYSFTRNVTGDVSSSYSIDEYINLDNEREDKIGSASVGLTFQPKKWLRIMLSYSYRGVDSSLNANNYEENRGALNISLTPSR